MLIYVIEAVVVIVPTNRSRRRVERANLDAKPTPISWMMAVTYSAVPRDALDLCIIEDIVFFI